MRRVITRFEGKVQCIVKSRDLGDKRTSLRGIKTILVVWLIRMVFLTGQLMVDCFHGEKVKRTQPKFCLF